MMPLSFLAQQLVYELRWYIDLLDGEKVRPDSGDLTKYEGVMDDAGGRISADVVVVTAGAWTTKLLPELEGHLFATAQPVLSLPSIAVATSWLLCE